MNRQDKKTTHRHNDGIETDNCNDFDDNDYDNDTKQQRPKQKRPDPCFTLTKPSLRHLQATCGHRRGPTSWTSQYPTPAGPAST